MESKKFVNGIRIFVPHENAPEFVKFSGVINKKEIIDFLKDKGDEVKFQVKQSQKGGFYAEIDLWQPSK